MKRILFCTQTASPVGGVETWLDRICEHLAGCGFDPVVAMVRGQTCNDPTRFRTFHPQLNAIEVDGRGCDREGRVRALTRAITRVKPAVVVPLGIVDANEATVRCKVRGEDLRLVAHAQGNLPPMLADLAVFRDWLDRVVCPGRLTASVLREWAGFLPARVENIANGADAPTLSRREAELGAALRIGYVGRLSEPDKRATDLIGLCESLAGLGVDFQLDVVGDGPCRERLATGLAAHGDRVRLHGALPREALYAWIFPNLDVLILPSATEAFGIVLIEAMVHGVVPVTSQYDGFFAEGLVTDGETGFAFPVGDMAAAAACVKRLAVDRTLLARLGQAAAVHANDYTWQRSLTRWQELLAAVIAEPPLRGTQPPALPAVPAAGMLDRLGLPASLIDLSRRGRRWLRGPAVAAGGEEWPLFHRHHSETTLAAVRDALNDLDRPPSTAAVAVA